jgi:crossover junction endonuclease MUS81
MAETCANPLLLGWIKEWLDQARERNSKGFTVYVRRLKRWTNL